jgi:hypothetical protein
MGEWFGMINKDMERKDRDLYKVLYQHFLEESHEKNLSEQSVSGPRYKFRTFSILTLDCAVR